RRSTSAPYRAVLSIHALRLVRTQPRSPKMITAGEKQTTSQEENLARRKSFVGEIPFRFEVDANWARLPEGYSWPEVAAVACDSKDRVFVFNRGEHPMMVFDRAGSFLNAWGEGVFARAHGLTIGPDDSVYCTDDLDHTVRKFTADGKLLFTLGMSGQPSFTGATSIDFRTIQHSGPPFYFPTNLALGPNGDLFISDGYGNARIHRFTPDGRLAYSWGEPGSGPGQFRVPHGVAVDRAGTVYVADRENSRIQMFSSDGKFLEEWREIARPCQIEFDPEGNLVVAELGYRAGMWPGTTAPTADESASLTREENSSPGGEVVKPQRPLAISSRRTISASTRAAISM
ncbi:MAG: peptidyl-alpha-hydroxyglycine alpha-amidating lyase family protein, partial [Verrucomicrobiota bacterium]